jgi:hypothetical protein
MPNIINRRKKKNKVPETVVNDESDSSEYDFSSKLNSKYNVMPEDIDKGGKRGTVKKEIPEDSISMRFEIKNNK